MKTVTWLTPTEVCELMKIPPERLRYWRMVHRGPAYHQISARIFRYDERDVQRYIDGTRIDPSARAATRIPNHAPLS